MKLKREGMQALKVWKDAVEMLWMCGKMLWKCCGCVERFCGNVVDVLKDVVARCCGCV